MRISRPGELVASLSLLLGSIIGLALVVTYVIWPERRHEEVLPLTLFMPNQVDFFYRETQFHRPDNPPTKQNKDIEAPCWAVFKILIAVPDSRVTGGVRQEVSNLDLPYGAATDSTPALAPRDACLRAVAFFDTFTSPNSKPLFVDQRDWNNAFFNESTGASVQEYYHTYPGGDPANPTLRILETRGDGVTVGGGFLLALCIAGILLSVIWLGLRLWDDLHPPPQLSNIMSGGGGGPESPRRSHFRRMGGYDDEEGEALNLDRGGGGGAGAISTSVLRSHASHDAYAEDGGDIELEERRLQDHRMSQRHASEEEQLASLESKYDDELADPPSRVSAIRAAAAPRSPVPLLHPPPSASGTASEMLLPQDEERAGAELRHQQEEVLRHQQMRDRQYE